MEVISNGFVILVAYVAMVAIIMGAVGGAIVWKIRGGLTRGSLSTAGIYLLAAVPIIGFPWLAVALIFGIPLLVLTFLITFLTAHHFETRANLHHILSILAAISTALIAGFLLLMLFRFNLWAPVWITLGADAYLILLVISERKVASQ